MNELEDIKLRALLNEMKLESPESNFSINVMNKIFKENTVLEKIKSQRVLGTGFWIILVLFIVLLAITFIASNSGIQPESQINNLLPELNKGVSTGYQTIFEKIGTVPLGIAGILLASSVLLFIDRFINSNSRIFAS